MKSYQQFFAELKRRRVFRVMAMYGGTAFVVLQVADLLAEGMGLPDQVLRISTFLVLIGFPIAIVLAWAFEATPEGVRRTSDATAAEIEAIVALPAAKRWMSGLLALAGMALLFGGGWWMGQRGDGVPAADVPPKSLAVLPFVDLSESGDQQWFSDGLTEEILNSLAALPALKVTARTSSFQFRGQDRDITEIAVTLGVANILEGSVRRFGDQLAVTAQLIRAADGSHLWSETYETDAADLFDVQQEVAERVAATLDVYLDDEERERMFRSGTRSVEAFEAFLQGVEMYRRWHVSFTDLEAARQGQVAFERAMALDPEYAEAAIRHMDLYAHVLMDGFDVGVTQEEALAGLMQDLERASANASSPLVRLIAELEIELFSPDWFRMGTLLEQLKAHPDVVDAQNLIWVANLLMVVEPELARAIEERVLESDPLSTFAWYRLAALKLAEGDVEEALATMTEGRRLVGQHGIFKNLERVISVRGNPVRARALLGEAGPQEDADWPDAFQLLLYREIGDQEEGAALAQRIDQLPAGSLLLIRLISATGTVPFELTDTPNFARRLQQAGIDLSTYGQR